jgi:Tol biopolymer transport system component
MGRRIKAEKRQQFALAITAACRVAMSSGLIAALGYLLLALVLLAAVGPAFSQSDPVGPGVRLQAGIEKEEVDGDLKSAMDIYAKIAVETSAPREVRARALLRLAGCEEKLGREAKHVYEQIVRDYAEQPVAAQARKRLALIKQQEQPPPPKTMSVRRIDWQTLGSLGPTDTDGERAVYWNAENLYFGDTAGHNRRLIDGFKHYGWIPCRDFSMVVLDLIADPPRPHTLAVIKTDGTGYRELIRDDAQNSIFGENKSFAMSCSWDDHNLLLSDFSVETNRVGQVWIVSVADGHRRILADAKEGVVRKAVFSPDGQFAAYEVWPRSRLEGEPRSQVFVVPVQGGEPRLVFESAPWQIGNDFMALMDWTADGRYISVHDIRQGKSALYLLPMKDGKADGTPAFVRFGSFDEGYTTASGALVYTEYDAKPGNFDIALASVGPDGHLGDWRGLNLNGLYNLHLSFSPDGSKIAYTGLDADPTRRNLVVRDLATGQERQIYRSPYPNLACQFSVKSPKVFCGMQKEEGETNLISVAVESGMVEQIATFKGHKCLITPGGDDETFHLFECTWSFIPYQSPFVRWDRSTQQETVEEAPSNDDRFELPSSDLRWLVRVQAGALSVRSTSGGDWRVLVSGIAWKRAPFVTSDGHWVWYEDNDSAGMACLFRVPAEGGMPQRIGALPKDSSSGEFVISPDGREVLSLRGLDRTYGLWVMENFVPSPQR